MMKLKMYWMVWSSAYPNSTTGPSFYNYKYDYFSSKSDPDVMRFPLVTGTNLVISHSANSIKNNYGNLAPHDEPY